MKLEEIKNNALERHIPIIMDETLNEIIDNIKPKEINRILEIGTAVGYSALCFSKILAPNGIIDTLERDEERIAEARINIKLLDVYNKDDGTNKRINIIEGDATETIEKLNKKYDMIFIDANKGKYPFYLKESLRLLEDGGVIFADNVLYKGYVMSDYNKHKQRTAVTHLREFIHESTENPELNTKIIEVGDGLAIIKKNVNKQKDIQKKDIK